MIYLFNWVTFWVSCLFSGVLYIWKEYIAPPREKQKWESKTFVALKDEVLFFVGSYYIYVFQGIVYCWWFCLGHMVMAKLFACFHPRGVDWVRGGAPGRAMCFMACD